MHNIPQHPATIVPMFTNPRLQKNRETREPGGVSGSGVYDRGGAAEKIFASVGWLPGEDDLASCINLL